jgi:hypothetical protein
LIIKKDLCQMEIHFILKFKGRKKRKIKKKYLKRNKKLYEYSLKCNKKKKIIFKYLE